MNGMGLQNEQFEFNQIGFLKADEFLKSVNEYDNFFKNGFSTDGYSLVHFANSVRARNNINNNNMSEKTIGEQRVRTDFNVSGSTFVDDIKQRTAELINVCESLKEKDPRLASLAQTTYEEAAMWAVKAATA